MSEENKSATTESEAVACIRFVRLRLEPRPIPPFSVSALGAYEAVIESLHHPIQSEPRQMVTIAFGEPPEPQRLGPYHRVIEERKPLGQPERHLYQVDPLTGLSLPDEAGGQRERSGTQEECICSYMIEEASLVKA